MANLTTYGKNLVATWLHTAGAATRPTAWYLGLGTGRNAAGLTGEPSGNGYARQQVTFTVTGGVADTDTQESAMTSATLAWPDKDPADVLDYSVDWSDQLALPATPDTIDSVTWTVPAGLTKTAQSHADGVATAWLSGGTAGRSYLVTCRIVTAGGRTIERSATLLVRDM